MTDVRKRTTAAACRAAFLLAVMIACVTPPVRAQSTVADIIGFLVTNRAVVTGDVERDQAAAHAARDTIARALLVNLTSTPLATSSSGFLYRLNPAIGTVERATESFGSFFVERALTAGRGRASFGASAGSATFTRLGSHNLRDGTFVTVANQFRDERAPYNTESLTLHVRSSTMSLFGNVGLTDRLEIGGVVPLVRLTIDGQLLNVYNASPFVQADASATSSGIGDIAVRAKYTLLSIDDAGVAAAAEFRLPTGDEANLLGTGSASLRILGIASFERGPFALHGNGGFLRGGISNEFSFAGAASYAVSPRVTVSGELLGRHVSELRDIITVSAAHPTVVGADTRRLATGDAGGMIVNAVTGVKWNPNGTFVVAGHLLWPLSRTGLTSRVTPTLALEYAF